MRRYSSTQPLALSLLALLSVSLITANPVPNPGSRAGITPPAETETAPTTERITTVPAAAITTMQPISVADAETQDIVPVQPQQQQQAENRTEPPVVATTPDQQQQQQANKEPSQGLVSFDQRQHGRFNIRADLDNFMIILLPQSSTKSPLLNLGGLAGSGSSSSFGSVPGSSLFDLFTRQAYKPPKRKSGGRRKNKVKYSSYKRKYQAMRRRQAQEQAEAEEADSESEAEQKEFKEAGTAPAVSPVTETAVLSLKVEQPAQDELKKLVPVDMDERGQLPEQDKYRMDTLEKIQHQLDILIKRVNAREALYDRPAAPAATGQVENFVEGRTPYRVEINSLTNDADILPSPMHPPMPFRQFRNDRPLEIGSIAPQPKFFQPWAFPSAAAAASGPAPMTAENLFAQRGPLMVAFRDGRSLLPRPEGNELHSNSILALPLSSLGFGRAMEIESNDASPQTQSQSSYPQSPSPTLTVTDDDANAETGDGDDDEVAGGSELDEGVDEGFAYEGFVDLTDTLHSFDSLNVDNVDKIETPTQTAQFNRDWDLKLLGASDDCGPDRRRDSYGICQFVQF